jgi:tripartite-type tricarboxylate transporter receptor subunit TctC
VPGYPSRPVRVVVPFPAGGITDMIARVLAQKLSERLGQQFYVENQPGGAGNIGTGQVANSSPDGHTILVVSSTLTVNPALFAKLPFDTLTDLAPVTLAARTDQALVVHPSVQANSVKEFIALVKANPGKFSYGTPGTGSTGHLAGAMFRMATDVDMVHVPFQGGGQLLSSLIGGHTPVVFTAMPLVAPAVKDGKLRALALTSEKRSAAYPDVPTMAEAGVADQVSDVVQGVLVRGGTPAPIIATLHREIGLILAEQDVKQRLAAAGFEPVGTTPEQFGTYIRTEIDKWAKVIRAANIKPH